MKIGSRLADWWRRGVQFVRRRVASGRARYTNFLKRRPHRSFRRTRSRDMPHVKPLPSNIFFTADVIGFIKQNKWPYLRFVLIFTVMFTIIAGVMSQENYASVSDGIKAAGPAIIGGDFGKGWEVLTLFGSVVTGQLDTALTETQQIYVGMLSLLTWLSIIWYARHRLQGINVVVRDAIYSSCAPLVASLVVTLVGLMQLVPGALGMIVFWASTATGTLSGVEAMLFGIAALLLMILSLYWVTSTLLALVIVTVPGTYPFKALSAAGDIVIGRRASVLLRLLWLAFIVVLLWVFVLVPIILLADALPWKWLPLVPIAVQLLSGLSLIFSATYVYLLYRRLIDVPAKKRSKKSSR